MTLSEFRPFLDLIRRATSDLPNLVGYSEHIRGCTVTVQFDFAARDTPALIERRISRSISFHEIQQIRDQNWIVESIINQINQGINQDMKHSIIRGG